MNSLVSPCVSYTFLHDKVFEFDLQHNLKMKWELCSYLFIRRTYFLIEICTYFENISFWLFRLGTIIRNRLRSQVKQFNDGRKNKCSGILNIKLRYKMNANSKWSLTSIFKWVSRYVSKLFCTAKMLYYSNKLKNTKSI